MKIHVIPALEDNYIFLLEKGGHAIVVDPGDAAPVLQRLEDQDLVLNGILLTHDHHDHIGGVGDLLDRFPNSWVKGPGGLSIDCNQISDGDQLEVLGELVEVIATPGHSLIDHSFHFPHQRALFCGDTLFVGGCGRVFSGRPDLLYASFDRIRKLPQGTKIYCGHEYTHENFRFARTIAPDDQAIQYRAANLLECNVPTTLAEECKTNLFMRAASVEAFIALRGRKDTF